MSDSSRLSNDERLILKAVAAGLEDVKQTRVKADIRQRKAEAGSGRVYKERFSKMVDSLTGHNILVAAEKAAQDDVNAMIYEAFPEIFRYCDNSDESKGIGLGSIARIIGEVGDPRWKTPHETIANPDFNPDKPTSLLDNPTTIQVPRAPEPRTLRELYAYAGIGDPDRRPNRKGITAEEVLACGRRNTRAVLYAITVNVLKKGGGGLYNDLYYAIKDKVADKVHDRPCQQCAGKGKAPESAIGVPWKDGHKHMHALRLVAKEILRDLWLITGGEPAQYGTGKPVLAFSQESLPVKNRKLKPSQAKILADAAE